MIDSTRLTEAQRRVLRTLLTEGPQTARELAEHLGISAVAVRQHLGRLEWLDLARPDSVAEGVGRPASCWRATESAHGALDDSHRQLSTELLRALQEEGLVDRVLERRTEEQLRRYSRHVDDTTDLAGRVEVLARLRTDEGYLARSWTEEDGTVCLAENHCPLKCAVDSCLGLCTAERELFGRFVGPEVRVERTEHIGSGDRRCVYRFRRG
jgi:predicted ArsR family transcriptional regulator